MKGYGTVKVDIGGAEYDDGTEAVRLMNEQVALYFYPIVFLLFFTLVFTPFHSTSPPDASRPDGFQPRWGR